MFLTWLSTFSARFMAVFYLLSVSFTGEVPKPLPVPAVNPAYTAQTETIKTMCYNVSNEITGEHALTNRIGGITEVILAELPDSLGVQEVDKTWRDALKKELAPTYGVACNVGREGIKTEGNPIYYNATKYAKISEGIFWLSERPLFKIRGKSWDAGYARTAAWVILRNKTTGFTYLHVNTHVDHLGPQSRDNAAALISNFINKINLPAVLTGDFNALRSESSYQSYLDNGFVDAAVQAPGADYERYTFNAWTAHGQKAVDYIFANGYFRSSANYKVFDDYGDAVPPSDHYAIVCDVTI